MAEVTVNPSKSAEVYASSCSVWAKLTTPFVQLVRLQAAEIVSKEGQQVT